MDDDFPDDFFDESFGDDFGDGFDGGMDAFSDPEAWQVAQDLDDLEAFQQVFAAEGYEGVSMWCDGCQEEHFHRWELLRQSLETLLETGEIPVHEPAFEPDPSRYVPWEYARGYVDALRDVGADQRTPLTSCPRCQVPLDGVLEAANWCPRCGAPLLAARLETALDALGVDAETSTAVLRAVGLPRSD